MKDKTIIVEVELLHYCAEMVIPLWTPLSETVRLTGNCRNVDGRLEREVETISDGWFGRKSHRTNWYDAETEFRTIEYFECAKSRLKAPTHAIKP